MQKLDGAATTLYADFTGLVECCESERGLLSIALAPDFEASGRFYAAYTGKRPPAAAPATSTSTRSSRTAPTAPSAGRRSSPSAIPPTATTTAASSSSAPTATSTSRSATAAAAGIRSGAGQSTATRLGKILRIDPQPGAQPPFTVPPGNPFTAPTDTRLDEIWSYGLRNPWRFSFDRLSGDMVIGDVGQGQREEIDLARSPAAGAVGGAGVNYGWNCREGLIAYSGRRAPATGRAASPTRSSTTRTPTPTRRRTCPTAARSPAATWSATRASATSTAATSTPTSAPATSGRLLLPASGSGPARATEPRRSRSPTRSPSARTRAGGST